MYLLFIFIFIMLAPKPVLSGSLSKRVEFKQDDHTYNIELVQNLNDLIFSIRDINKIDEYYKLEISFEDIQKKNLAFKIYTTIEELIK